MNRIRNRLIAIFLAATLAPLAATWWIATRLLEHSVALSSVDQLDRLSQTLARAGREAYVQAGEALRSEVARGQVAPEAPAPAEAAEFAASGEPDRIVRSPDGSRLILYVKRGEKVVAYSRPLALNLNQLSSEYRRAREAVTDARGRDLRRGLIQTFAVLAAGCWLVSLALLIFLAHRVSRPIQKLTAGLARLAAGDFETRIAPAGGDETSRAIRAFNDTAAQLEQNRDRLVYLAQLASWRMLARKMAHELKNSLTPIRLTMEEVLARRGDNDAQFVEQAARIVVDEVESLERRVRAFSEFSSEPPVRPADIDVNQVVEERVALLAPAHPDVRYETRLAAPAPVAHADEDLVKGILTNLLENAAEAAGERGTVRIVTAAAGGRVAIEVHDSGPGLSEQARQALFEPTISFKKRGMGLGLSIAHKNALLSGGNVEVIEGQLGGAAFLVTLPEAPAPAHTDRSGFQPSLKLAADERR